MAKNLTAYQELTERHRIFVNEYCSGEKSGRPYNAIAAAEVAGYAHPTIYGGQLRRNPKIRKAIEEVLSELIMSPEEVVKRFQDIATSDIGDIVDIDPVTKRPTINPDALNKKKRFLKSFSYDSNGNPKYEFHDAHAALKDLARAMGVHGADGLAGGPTNVTVNINFIRAGENPADVNTAIPAETVQEAEWEEEES